jgi:hypothetical protein
LNIEKDFEVVQFFSLFLKLACLDIVLCNFSVRILNDFLTNILFVVWAAILEIKSEFSNFNLEFKETRFDVACFLGLHGQDLLLNGTECVHADINELCL